MIERPPRPSQLQGLLRNERMWDTFLILMGPGYAGDDENPRPVPDVDNAEWRRRWNLGYETKNFVDLWRTPNALLFTFGSDSIHWEPAAAVPVPREDLWWLLAEEDCVFLSDRVIHHYTTVTRVDREAERVFFSDPWPEQFFLLPGMNAAGVKAEAKPLSISKQEFLRVIVAVTTTDTPELARSYLIARPEQRDNAKTCFELGLSLLDPGRDILAPEAVPYLRMALERAESDRDGDLATSAAAYLFLALQVSYYHFGGHTDETAAKLYADELHQLLQSRDVESLTRPLSAGELGRLGNAALYSKDSSSALRFFDLAVAEKKTDERAHAFRARARGGLGDWPGAEADSSTALALNDRNRVNAQREVELLDHRDRHGRQRYESGLKNLQTWRREELVIRAAARAQQKNHTESIGDLDAALEISSGPDVYLQRAVVQEDAGFLEQALHDARQARTLAEDSGQRRLTEVLIDRIETRVAQHPNLEGV